MTDYHIRPAAKADIGSIVELCEAHANFEGCDYNRKGKAERLSTYLFKEKPLIRCLVLEIGQDIMGYATYMREFSTWDAAYYMHMDCLYFKPEARRKGYGRKFIERIFAEAKAEGCVNVQWQTPADNMDAIAFYNSIGGKSKTKIRFQVDM